MSAVLSACQVTSCVQEQAWNEACLARPVARPSLQLWRYAGPGVVLGRRQYALAQGGRLPGADDLVVRGAGGGAVLTGPWMLSASILLPPDHPLLGTGVVASYRWLGVLHAGLLRDLGIDAHALSPEAVRRHDATGDVPWACFGGLSPWEVAVGGRKIVGLAQVRRKQGVLLASGTLVSAPAWQVLCDALGQPAEDARRLARLTTSCEEQLGAPVLMEVLAERLSLALLDLLGPL
ncbi:lipoate--protein ligase family protein [Bordetella hinzii]|uniref:Lipoate--protein ligase n=1 Tax=Bordetella hinzii TaxID=103855 RepID=A0AAN1RUP9_9BORD|nr:hypothetical protein [Bordetella hinzii]AKQ53775.1 Octanoyltransferase LipM [Bordetella hinzii]AKQ58317.1 Octanoyltransferase LipM [Bordetella hinzii]AZW16353.1 lipoate--protein ligase [Bordetella hinzii]KCB29744.1 hypothetical protein L543_0428 [Bordetella hinzii L60]KCB43282.1 hypothetical protein L538_0414 [Bordetella hinzii 4161]